MLVSCCVDLWCAFCAHAAIRVMTYIFCQGGITCPESLADLEQQRRAIFHRMTELRRVRVSQLPAERRKPQCANIGNDWTRTSDLYRVKLAL
jgi:hypothetical protein